MESNTRGRDKATAGCTTCFVVFFIVFEASLNWRSTHLTKRQHSNPKKKKNIQTKMDGKNGLTEPHVALYFFVFRLLVLNLSKFTDF